MTQSFTLMRPSVIVPVLSRHNTFTLASISKEYRSCTSVLFLASLIRCTFCVWRCSLRQRI